MKKLNNSLTQLVTLLNDGQSHDGTTIGSALAMTRSGVWKAIKKLESYGVAISSVKGKGYALQEPLILLDKEFIAANVANKNLEIEVFETLDSTNDYLKLLGTSKNPRVCLTEQQTRGKGRLQRHWYSPFGLNIYFSCLYPFQKDISEMAGLSLVVSLAVAKTLSSYSFPGRVNVKWPNDVMYQGQKLSGSLIEMQAESHGTTYATIGIGINVNMLHDKNERITQAWTSLRNMTGEYIDRNLLCVALINQLLMYLKRFDKFGLVAFLDEWHSLDGLVGETMTLKSGLHEIHGRMQGINEHGHLLLQLPDGGVKAFSSGDTSVMKRG